MSATNPTQIEVYNERFSKHLLQLSYSRLTRPSDNPYVAFQAGRVVKPHGVSYNAFEQAVGHRYSKACGCVMCSSVTRGQVIGILPEPVCIEQKVKRKPFTMPIASIPEPPPKRVIIPLQFEV